MKIVFSQKEFPSPWEDKKKDTHTGIYQGNEEQNINAQNFKHEPTQVYMKI